MGLNIFGAGIIGRFQCGNQRAKYLMFLDVQRDAAEILPLLELRLREES